MRNVATNQPTTTHSRPKGKAKWPLIGIFAVGLMVVTWVGRPIDYLMPFQGRQAATIFLVISNFLIVLFLLFRKQTTGSSAERIYKELYTEERITSGHYRNLIDHLKMIETEKT